MSDDTKIKWLQLSNSDDTASLKQHGYVRRVCKAPYTLEQYIGNRSLCGKAMVSEDGETAMDFFLIEPEKLNESIACKTCLKLSSKI